MSRIITFILSWFTTHLIATLFKYIFSSVIGLVSYQFVAILVQRYLNAAMQELNTIGILATMIDISKLDVAISIIIGAFAIRGSILAMGLAITKPNVTNTP